MCSLIITRHSYPHPGRRISKTPCIYSKFIAAYNSPDSPLYVKYAELLKTYRMPGSGRQLDLSSWIDTYRKECEKLSKGGEENVTFVDKEALCGACELWLRRGWKSVKGKGMEEEKGKDREESLDNEKKGKSREDDNMEYREDRKKNDEDEIMEDVEEESTIDELKAFLDKTYGPWWHGR